LRNGDIIDYNIKVVLYLILCNKISLKLLKLITTYVLRLLLVGLFFFLLILTIRIELIKGKKLKRESIALHKNMI